MLYAQESKIDIYRYKADWKYRKKKLSPINFKYQEVDSSLNQYIIKYQTFYCWMIDKKWIYNN